MVQGDKPKLPRRPTEVPLNEDEERLFQDLEIVFEENLEVTDFGRHAASEAVQLVLNYLDKRGLSGQAMKPLIDISNALQNVESGVLPELFDPKATNGSGPEGSRTWSRSDGGKQIKHYAAGCMGALMITGVRKEEAAMRVARAAQSWPRFSAGVIKANTVANWRDELMQAEMNNPGRLMYECLVSNFSVGPKAKQYLEEVLHKGPQLTGGKRRSETKPKT